MSALHGRVIICGNRHPGFRPDDRWQKPCREGRHAQISILLLGRNPPHNGCIGHSRSGTDNKQRGRAGEHWAISSQGNPLIGYIRNIPIADRGVCARMKLHCHRSNFQSDWWSGPSSGERILVLEMCRKRKTLAHHVCRLCAVDCSIRQLRTYSPNNGSDPESFARRAAWDKALNEEPILNCVAVVPISL